MLGCFAEYERAIIRERTIASLLASDIKSELFGDSFWIAMWGIGGLMFASGLVTFIFIGLVVLIIYLITGKKI